MLEVSAHAETLLTVVIAAIPNIILAMAAYKKVGKNERKLDTIQKQTNGNLAEMKRRTDFLSHRLSKYERLPSNYKVVKDEGNSQPGSGNRGGSDASGPGGELGGNEESV